MWAGYYAASTVFIDTFVSKNNPIFCEKFENFFYFANALFRGSLRFQKKG